MVGRKEINVADLSTIGPRYLAGVPPVRFSSSHSRARIYNTLHYN